MRRIIILTTGSALLVAGAGFLTYELVSRVGTALGALVAVVALILVAAMAVALTVSSKLQRGILEQIQLQDSALKTRTAELEAATRELSAFNYSVSHDLRAPLRIIDGFSEAVAEDYQDKLDDRGLDYLNRVREATARMELLINSLLELSRVSRVELRRETVNLSEMAESIAAELKRSEPTRNVQFSIQPGLIVEGDPALLRVAIAHLLGNAWKFTKKHPTAKIELGREERDGNRSIFLRDDGAGFDSADTARMFGAFQRFHSEAEFEGTGIGLALVQRIIYRHGGKIRIEGKVEEGTTVYIDLE